MTGESDPAEESRRRSDSTYRLFRRSTIGAMAATGFLGLASTTASAAGGSGEGERATLDPVREVIGGP